VVAVQVREVMHRQHQMVQIPLLIRLLLTEAEEVVTTQTLTLEAVGVVVVVEHLLELARVQPVILHILRLLKAMLVEAMLHILALLIHLEVVVVQP
jgi:hypothetical protein